VGVNRIDLPVGGRRGLYGAAHAVLLIHSVLN
jgi:hypothetical protein